MNWGADEYVWIAGKNASRGRLSLAIGLNRAFSRELDDGRFPYSRQGEPQTAIGKPIMKILDRSIQR